MAERAAGRRTRALARLAALGMATAVVASGCTARYRNSAAPRCSKTDTLVLMAQSVPSAPLVPCIDAIPAGWTFGEMDIGNGRSEFSLDSDEAGVSAVQVTLAPTCDTSRASEVASDQPGTRRFERIESLVEGYTGTRAYRFDGGCVVYRLEFEGEGAKFINDVRTALGWTTRTALAADVFRRSGGRLRL